MSGPKKIKLKAKVNIHDIIRECNRCSGRGSIRQQSGHGAFGETEYGVIGCPDCLGVGYLIYDHEKIKDKLEKIHKIKLKNNEAHVEYWGDV